MAITVDCDYPGGNIILRKIDGSRIVVTQDQRDTEEWWFWWNFRVRGAAGRTLRVEFDNPRGGPVGPNGPVMSTDRRQWRWAREADGGGPCAEFDDFHFVVAVPEAADEVFFAKVIITFSGANYSSGLTFQLRQPASDDILQVIDAIDAATSNMLREVSGGGSKIGGVSTQVEALSAQVGAGVTESIRP